MEIDPRQRNVLLVGALIGAMLGLGAAWLMLQSAEDVPGESKKPINPGEVFKLTSHAAGFLREVDDLRRRM
jgi:hypothetical protein